MCLLKERIPSVVSSPYLGCVPATARAKILLRLKRRGTCKRGLLFVHRRSDHSTGCRFLDPINFQTLFAVILRQFIKHSSGSWLQMKNIFQEKME
ncbi:hypothetical protein CEXT_301551 [Caerostris extrusa]|uniref:Uncharacterized protein n=1 Tax=Caerostris extrusa TaxID=172846 RepID=A0AAV4Q2B9_CAEEX|nr:hypothetical protein CEXT_301551 [Caerostris extrusa]